MKYTEEEESWLQSQVHLVDDAYRSVPMGDAILDEIAMFTLGVPLSKSFIKVSISSTFYVRIFHMNVVSATFSTTCN